jgi:hypothetical protein
MIARAAVVRKETTTVHVGGTPAIKKMRTVRAADHGTTTRTGRAGEDQGTTTERQTAWARFDPTM